jgi:2,3-bisphosphoglycerate-independent phosphoglycerate mutase
MNKKVLLMILDGWGIGAHDKSNVIYSTGAPNMDAILNKYAHGQLLASGENVGLPDGQMGNSEVGHLNIGAGRVVYQDLVKINIACRDNSILKNEEIVKAYSYARDNGKQIHLLGLVSNGGVHSSMGHLFKDLGREGNGLLARAVEEGERHAARVFRGQGAEQVGRRVEDGEHGACGQVVAVGRRLSIW